MGPCHSMRVGLPSWLRGAGALPAGGRGGRMARSGRALAVTALAVLAFAGCRNVQTPAGYVGYVTQGAILGKSRFYALQSGPTASCLGRPLTVITPGQTPYHYT